jgi:hypothetical protein
MILFIIILTLSLTSFPVAAQEFFEYEDNPVITKTQTSTAVAQPSVLKNGNIFTAWFADSLPGGLNRISSMKSANGIDWYDKHVLSVSHQPTLTDPFMMEDNGEYILYFASVVNGSYTIWRSKSPDGQIFTPGQETQMLGPTSSWERSHVSSPAVIKSGNTYYLFYAGANGGTWSLGLATSPDGISWQRCPNNPFVTNSSGPHIIKYNDTFSLFYRSNSGLRVQHANVLNGCNTTWTAATTITPRISDPAPVQVGDDLWLYGFSNTSGGMTVWLSANVHIPKPEYPVVIIPGMFASWNKDAILHNTHPLYDAWVMNPAVSEYIPLQSALGSKAALFPYDWRQSIIDTTNNLDQFLNSKFWNTNPYQPVQLVGHSLGGVVSRIYVDKNPNKPIKQIITAGSPHLGLVQAYKPLERGEIDRENTLLWLAQKLILNLNKPLFQTEKEAITQKFPVLFDILPSFPFLKNDSEIFIPSSLENTLISQYPIQPTPQIPQYFIGGSGSQTLAGYTPTSSWKEDGDGLVLVKSSLNKLTPVPIQNHGELIYTKESVKNILAKLNIQVADENIPTGKATNLFPTLFVFIQSPATAKIIHNGVTTNESEGMIWLQNTVNDTYSLQVTGSESGEYTVSIWLIGADDDKWIQYKKSTTTGKVDEYVISFNTASGGTVSEYVPPTPTPTIAPTPTPAPTRIPSPTKRPTPTTKPRPTRVPPKPIARHRLGRLIQIIIRYIVQLHRK